MAWVAYSKDGLEEIFSSKPHRVGLAGTLPYWSSIGDAIVLPKGSIKKLIGRELSWSDEPVELKDSV